MQMHSRRPVGPCAGERPRTIGFIPAVATHRELRDAVERISADALAVTWDADAESLARRSLDESGLLLLGECHGVAENAAAIRAVSERLRIGVLALEWPTELAPVVQRFADEGRLTDHPRLWLGDGRITAEHFAVLRALSETGLPSASSTSA